MSQRAVGVLLRAVNVAGRRLAMADLKAALTAAGFEGVHTLGATGNAVVRAPAADATLEARLEAGLKAAFGATPDVLVRDAEQLQAVVAANPFTKMAEEAPHHLVVMFLRGEPAPALVEALRAKIKGPEEVAAGPACLYARYPDDIGHSKLTGAVIERTLKLCGTARNWNTVTKLAALLEEA
ncbi:DUF1697 domain-containing protein [Phenylobacterium sp. LjRoot225]|uniref:DUF1697 domain-containing protein n=1 Tax=Phenylobacterium sp. LjRoot225 TaxID=3342285 RepID=UPI003ECE027A